MSSNHASQDLSGSEITKQEILHIEGRLSFAVNFLLYIIWLIMAYSSHTA